MIFDIAIYFRHIAFIWLYFHFINLTLSARIVSLGSLSKYIDLRPPGKVIQRCLCSLLTYLHLYMRLCGSSVNECFIMKSTAACSVLNTARGPSSFCGYVHPLGLYCILCGEDQDISGLCMLRALYPISIVSFFFILLISLCRRIWCL